ncbi:MAG: hypothetical protein ACKO3R_02660, partial [bacterium]
MNIGSVFSFKLSAASLSNSTQSLSQASSPALQSLEEDSKFNRGFEFALKNILNGKFDEAVIDGLVNPKFDSEGYLRNDQGDIKDRNNNLIAQRAFPELKNLNLSPSDAEVLKRLFQINSKNQQFAKEAQLNLNAISFALKNILNGKFDEAVIDGLVNPKFDSEGYLRNDQGDIKDRNNN